MTSALDPRLAPALARHHAGDLQAAAEAYRAILRDQPDQPDALHLLGVTEQQQGRFAESAALIGRALALRPDATIACNLANALLRLGRLSEAEAASRQALVLDPQLAMGHANLGAALHGQGRLAEAANAFRIAIALDPARPDPQASLGVVLLDLGRRAESIAVLRAVLAAFPDHVQALYNLGNSLAAEDRSASLVEALAYYERALSLAPAYAEAAANRAALLRRMDRLDEAAAAFDQALALNPNAAIAHYNHGLLLGELGRPEAALAAHDRAIALQPDLALAHSQRGNVLSALDRHAEAMAAHDQALALDPNDAALWHNLGLSLGHQALFADAIQAQRRAIAADPGYAPAHAALAACLAHLDLCAEALDEARTAIALDPELATGYSALGQALMADGRPEEALAPLREAIARRPNLPQGQLNLGVALYRLGRLDAAEAAYLAALRLPFVTWEGPYDLGVLRLKQGRYDEAWALYEHRLRAPQRQREDARYPQPLWQGEDLTGQSLLLCGEQGLGDMLQCLRFIPQVAALGARVVVEAHPALHRLIAALPEVAEVVAPGVAPTAADFRAPLFSLPHRLGLTLEALPGRTPYLTIPRALSATWRERLDQRMARPAPRVGVVWSGNIESKVDLGRSFALADLAPVAAAIGAPLISLQKRFGLDQLGSPNLGFRVAQLGPDYDAGDLADTGAVLEQIDLLIACDTSVAHLAGALGVPVWLAINAVGDWRWLEDRSDSPWYPSLRLYRQPSPGDWRGVFEAMAADWPAFAAQARA